MPHQSRQIPPSLNLEARMDLYALYEQLNPGRKLIKVVTPTRKPSQPPEAPTETKQSPLEDNELDDIFGSLKQKREAKQKALAAAQVRTIIIRTVFGLIFI